MFFLDSLSPGSVSYTHLQIVALDKTGTITSGQPEVTDILPAEGFSEEQLLTLAFSLEQKSEHRCV